MVGAIPVGPTSTAKRQGLAALAFCFHSFGNSWSYSCTFFDGNGTGRDWFGCQPNSGCIAYISYSSRFGYK